MSNELTVPAKGMHPALAKVFTAERETLRNELSTGVMASFGVLSIRGRNWRVKYKGEESIIRNEDGDPKGSIDVILIRASTALSKIYYDKPYQEGDDNPPDCFSLGGEKPDPSAPHKQSKLCQSCPKNAFGSRITESGSKAKACSDSRRVAVVPSEDVANEMWGGPMLLRIPPASLSALSSYGDKLDGAGFAYYGVKTTIGFDEKVAYPKLVFKVKGRIDDDDDALQVLEWRSSEEVSRLLTDSTDLASEARRSADEPEEKAEAEEEVEEEVEEEAEEDDPLAALGVADNDPEPEPEPEKPKTKPKTKKTAAKKTAAKPSNGADEPPVADTGLEGVLDDVLSGLST